MERPPWARRNLTRLTFALRYVAVTLPIAVLMAFIAMNVFGVDANIMSLAGIAIAIGTMVDMGIVVSESIYDALAHWEAEGRPGHHDRRREARRRQPPRRCLEQAFLPEDAGELLGMARPAERPEPRAVAAGEDDGLDHGVDHGRRAASCGVRVSARLA